MIRLTNITSAILSFGSIEGIIKYARKINKEKEYTNIIIDVLKEFNNYDHTDRIQHGVMFNALTEANNKDILYLFKKDMPELMVQADSGGLQIITAGLSDDPQTKENVYHVQADYCDYAMSFDKMPILLDKRAEKNIKLDNSLKYFIAEYAHSSGRESGFNIKRQIEIFMKKNSKAKVLCILQGWSINEYNEYAKGLFSVFNEMDEETREKYYQYIGGISIGTTAIISYFNMLDVFVTAHKRLTNVPKRFRNFIHFLALGGITKSGILFMLDKDFYDDDVHITFDSTSNASAATYGKFNIKEGNTFKTVQLGFDLNKHSKLFIAEMYKAFNKIIEKNLNVKLSIHDFRNRFTIWNDEGVYTIKDIEKAHPDYTQEELDEKYLGVKLMYRFLHFALEYKKYVQMTHEIQKQNFNIFNDNVIKKVYQKLSTIKTYDEYMENREYFKLLLKGKKESNVTFCKTYEDYDYIQNKQEQQLLEEW